MSVKEEQKLDEPVSTIKQKCVNCLKGPNLIKTIVALTCTALVVQQISVCVMKLINVPVTTYTHFDFNKTIWYPSVTLCKEPAYKFDKLAEYGLYGHPRYTSAWANFNFSAVDLVEMWHNITYNADEIFVNYGLDSSTDSTTIKLLKQEYGLYRHPRYTSTWANFNFSAVDLVEMWHNITYDADEFFVNYGLDSSTDTVELTSTMGFYHGRCHTLVPKAPSEQASRESGYSITLQHELDDVANVVSEHPPGYHVFVHYTMEPFTEVDVYNGGLVGYLYINMGETVTVRLTVDEYLKIGDSDDICTNAEGYSANMCTTKYVWDLVSNEVGCSGPWMVSKLPICNNYKDIRDVISRYLAVYKDHNLTPNCPRFCRALLYNTYVTNRQMHYYWDTSEMHWAMRTGEAEMQTQLYLQFHSKMVSVYKERYTYDWNIFVSDLGGSIGFLLGLSVIGLIEIFGKLWVSTISPFIRKPKTKKDSASVSSSTVTARLENNIDRNVFDKCEDWNRKNNLKNYN